MIKIIQLERFSDEQVISFKRNLEMMLTFDHPNIPLIHSIYFDENFAYILMDFIDGAEVLDHIISVK